MQVRSIARFGFSIAFANIISGSVASADIADDFGRYLEQEEPFQKLHDTNVQLHDVDGKIVQLRRTARSLETNFPYKSPHMREVIAAVNAKADQAQAERDAIYAKFNSAKFHHSKERLIYHSFEGQLRAEIALTPAEFSRLFNLVTADCRAEARGNTVAIIPQGPGRTGEAILLDGDELSITQYASDFNEKPSKFFHLNFERYNHKYKWHRGLVMLFKPTGAAGSYKINDRSFDKGYFLVRGFTPDGANVGGSCRLKEKIDFYAKPASDPASSSQPAHARSSTWFGAP